MEEVFWELSVWWTDHFVDSGSAEQLGHSRLVVYKWTTSRNPKYVHEFIATWKKNTTEEFTFNWKKNTTEEFIANWKKTQKTYHL